MHKGNVLAHKNVALFGKTEISILRPTNTRVNTSSMLLFHHSFTKGCTLEIIHDESNVSCPSLGSVYSCHELNWVQNTTTLFEGQFTLPTRF